MAGAKTETIKARVSPDVAGHIAAMAAKRGLSLSEYLRWLANEDKVDEEDSALLQRLAANEPGALGELLSLNPVSLVHRQCLGDAAALGLVLAYGASASDEGKRKLIVALTSAIEQLRSSTPDIDDMNVLAERLDQHTQRRLLTA